MDALIIGVLIIIFILFFFIFKQITDLKKASSDKTIIEWLKSMESTLGQANRVINESLLTNSSMVTRTLQENSKQLNERLDKAASVISSVSREIGQMSEIGRSMRELQEFLNSPKLRGNIGEQILNDLIKQIFPKNSFYLQYQFKSGQKVDAAIKTDAGLLPIDSKFPMENFNKYSKASADSEKEIHRKDFLKDVKKHVDAISQKYILPDEGTMDFALMYVPSEAIFYEMANTPELMEYARTKRVYLVSPSTLYMHLQTILLSFEGHKIESQTKEVLTLLRALQIDYKKVNESMDTLGHHIGNASSQYSNMQKGFWNFGQRLESVKYIGEKQPAENNNF